MLNSLRLGREFLLLMSARHGKSSGDPSAFSGRGGPRLERADEAWVGLI